MVNIIKRKKGVALLWTLIICFVLLIVSGTMVGFITKESQASVRIEDSVQAYAAAKSGLEWGNWYVKNYSRINPSGGDINSTFTVPVSLNPVISAKVLIQFTKATGAGKIESEGEINGVKRKILFNLSGSQSYKWPANANQPEILSPQICSSFKIQYDFWLDRNAYPFQDFEFGVANSVTGKNLYMNVDTYSNVTYAGIQSAGVTTPMPSIVLVDKSVYAPTYQNDTNRTPTEPYNYRAELKYIKNLSATIEISRRSISGDDVVYTPIGSQSIKMIGKDLGTIDRIYIRPNGWNYYDNGNSGSGDGSNLQVNGNYVDNVLLFGATTGCTNTVPPPPPPPPPPADFSIQFTGTGSGTVRGIDGDGIEIINCSSSSGGSCSIAPTHVTLSEDADSGSTFTGFSGICSGDSGICYANFDSDPNPPPPPPPVDTTCSDPNADNYGQIGDCIYNIYNCNLAGGSWHIDHCDY